MSAPQDGKGLTPAEMEAEEATALPDREAMSVVPSLLDVDANLDLALDMAAPIDAAVAANANVAAPIDAAVSANIASPDATSVASANQDSVIAQSIEGDPTATAEQTSAIDQGEAAAGGSPAT